MTNVISRFDFKETTVRFIQESDTQVVGMEMYPRRLESALVTPRRGIGNEPYIAAMPGAGNPPARRVDPVVHVKLVGDWYPGAFAQGRTMRSSPAIARFKFRDQQVFAEENSTIIVTVLVSNGGLEIEHHLQWRNGENCGRVWSVFKNGSMDRVTLELLTSFSMGGITPFARDDAPGRLRIHRFRSAWSAEARLQTETLEQLHLERSWSGAGLFSERFGQVGTMPVRGWFPFIAAEDIEAKVTWGAQLAWAGSWQLEVSRQNDELCLSGGLADRECGHWTKDLSPGVSLTSPTAIIACVAGGVDELCDCITAAHEQAADKQPAVEHELPIVFNEWCTTWGDPSHDKVLRIADRLCGSDAKYLVIDAGWYKGDAGDWGNAHGDWIPSDKLFPDGLGSIAAAIRGRGLIPGLWFEMETVGDASVAFSLTDHLLKRDGLPITVRNRRFWNLNDPFVVDYLAQKVIGTLRNNGFGYLKVDYNETAGLGCDGYESQGEGLRQHVGAVYRFFEHIRQSLPDLVIENCSSGGHRLEPSMLALTAMSSFSDAHELVEIPIIASNLHRLMLPRQSQIWAVLHPSDSEQRLAYSLAATFLGRMCLSGDIVGLNASQWSLVEQAMHLYRLASPIIKQGVSRRYGGIGDSWRYPQGWQAVVREGRTGTLVVLHTFGGPSRFVRVPLPPTATHCVGAFGVSAEIQSSHLVIESIAPFCSSLLLLS